MDFVLELGWCDFIDDNECSSNLWIKSFFTPDKGKLRTFSCDFSSGTAKSFHDEKSSDERNETLLRDMFDGGMMK